jgi:VanZ family protein
MPVPRIPTGVFRAILAVTLVVILYLSTTQQEFAIIDDTNDKVKHVLAFYVLAFLADYSAPNVSFNRNKVVMILGYGLLIEVIQYFLPYREFSLFDLAADGIGIAAYALSRPVLGRINFLHHP